MQDDIFEKGCIPWWVGVGGYVIFAVLAIIVIPFLYTPVRWYVACPSYKNTSFFGLHIVWQFPYHKHLACLIRLKMLFSYCWGQGMHLSRSAAHNSP